VPNAVHLADLSTDALRALLDGGAPCAALVPVGSVEPHGPHLPLATDTLISVAAAERAAGSLREKGIPALVAPPVGYGVTRFAEGFAGAISIPPSALSAFLRAIALGLLGAGFAHVSLVNSHLEPDHDAAVRSAVEGLARASVASPLTRRWARTLSPEFKSGACHAGRYETSIVLFAQPASVDMDLARGLPDVSISLSEGIRAGQTSFRAMGIERAYTGSPREASAEEGSELLDRLAAMIAAEVEEGIAALSGASG
jgi:creatinine amidohydrolase